MHTPFAVGLYDFLRCGNPLEGRFERGGNDRRRFAAAWDACVLTWPLVTVFGYS